MFFHTVLVSATLLCSLVAGFLFAFAVVAMPGISRLNDRSFIRAFQVIDGVIQENQPIFMFVWVGSVAAIVVAAVIGFSQIDGANRAILIAAAVVYLLGVQLPTVRINIPLNNKIQAIDVEQKDDQELLAARGEFEDKWNRWNVFRTVISIAIALSLHVLLLRI
ncbi:anthrone oxygenase family protein [Rhodopirellula europaea]|mgnify:FL=1|jgi:uncharacterized membrane protein|nr:anthrone oxygenase family protein [Rhodopirellula europaea]MCR9211218.1 DUF1772 domain-containing protein [bacterium]